MKRLNRKGFTLVELLAVIVILAIVVGITLTTILPTIKDSRQESFNTSANVAAEFLEKQYQLSLVGDITGTQQLLTTIPTAVTDISSDDLKKAGLEASNYDCTSTGSCTWYINSTTGRACVKLTASQDGDYHPIDNYTATSSGC